MIILGCIPLGFQINLDQYLDPLHNNFVVTTWSMPHLVSNRDAQSLLVIV